MLVVPRTRTPLPFAALKPLVRAAFEAEGRTLSDLAAVNLTALVAVETARGSAIQNGNVGNISASERYEGRVWRPPWYDDESHPEHARMLAGQAPSAFRAYYTNEDGARDFARLLLSSRYAPLMRAADQPDADTFRRALLDSYSPDYGPSSTRTFAQLQAELGLTSSVTPPVRLAGLGWLALALFLVSKRRR